MPYITQKDREHLNTPNDKCSTYGDLNYCLTKDIVKYIKQRGLSYNTIHEVKIACLLLKEGKQECCTELSKIFYNTILNKAEHFLLKDVYATLDLVFLEFYRRIAIPYEDSKLSENGDVYE